MQMLNIEQDLMLPVHHMIEQFVNIQKDRHLGQVQVIQKRNHQLANIDTYEQYFHVTILSLMLIQYQYIVELR